MARFAGSRDLTLNPGPCWLTDVSGSGRRWLPWFELLASATFLGSSGDDPDSGGLHRRDREPSHGGVQDAGHGRPVP